MNYSTDNTRIVEKFDLVTPEEVISKYPLDDSIAKLVYGTRNKISQILHGKDDRIVAVVGPCSIHDQKSAIEYANLLNNIKAQFEENILLIMRVYFEKPRTSIGWKGLINDPDLNNTFDVNKGLYLARSILYDISQLGLPVGTEFLDPISPQFVADLISWGAIGARTAESQIHRELASGLSCPIGFKNGTTGDLKPAIFGIKAANHSHVFFSNTKEGKVSIYKTNGNSDSHIILRGGKEPNLHPEDVKKTIENAKYLEKELQKRGISSFRNSLSSTIIFERPPEDFVLKWQLACTGDIAHVVVMPSVDKGKLDLFLKDIDQIDFKKKCLRKYMDYYCQCSKCKLN